MLMCTRGARLQTTASFVTAPLNYPANPSLLNICYLRVKFVPENNFLCVEEILRVGIVRCATIEEIEAEKSSIEKDAVEYYGTPVSLKSIAQISTPDSSSLLIQPYDKSSLKAIEKAIVNSDLGMTPNNDGKVIHLSLPQLTTERRKELSKVVAKQAEERRVLKLL